jgi:hypothetical protein
VTDESLTISFTTDRTPAEAFAAVTDVRGWWAGAAGSEVRFTHRGLVPRHECFDRCSPAWNHYIGTSLRDRIASGATMADNATAAD